MLTLVTGGSASGKSEYAENLATSKKSRPLIYVATMLNTNDDECLKRINHHKSLRAGKGFQTIECPLHLEELVLPNESCVLLECLSNLLANEIYHPNGRKAESLQAILSGISFIRQIATELIIISNEVFSSGEHQKDEIFGKLSATQMQSSGDALSTNVYLPMLGQLNQVLASCSEQVVEVVCGIPIFHKYTDIC